MEKKLKEKLAMLITKADKRYRAAQRLYRDGLYEDAISRAYYAMSNAGYALLLTKGLSPKRHSGLINLLSLHFVKKGKLDREYMDMLKESKDLRENGDYEIYFQATKQEAALSIKNAKKFIKGVKEILRMSYA